LEIIKSGDDNDAEDDDNADDEGAGVRKRMRKRRKREISTASTRGSTISVHDIQVCY
jgi:hypothetical protein